MLELLETIRVNISASGCKLHLEPHLERLSGSAAELGYSFNKESTVQEINQLLKEQRLGLYKLRIKLKQSAAPSYDLEPYSRFQDPGHIIKIKILNPSRYHSLSDNPLTRHKTNLRGDFSDELANVDEVIWLNERNEVAEGSYTNLFFQSPDNSWHTPSLETGILPGTMRAQILGETTINPEFTNIIKEIFQTKINQGLYTVENLRNAKRVIVTNAMLGPREATIID